MRLRAHHLLCMLTYVGQGYTAAFTANYDAVARRLSAGEEILLVDGPDDICAPLLAATADDASEGAHAEPHCLRPGVRDRDAAALDAVSSLTGLALDAGRRLVLDPPFLAAMRKAFAAGETRAACAGCEWSDLCTRVAAGGYDGTRLG